MFDLKKDWSISFAGCGFMGIYYVGATSCILERFPRLIQGASSIYGASAGSLMAVVLTLELPLEKCCADLMFMAREARKRKLGPLHPAYNLLKIVQDSLLGILPEDAHVRASGKLCVSVTRVSDGKNVLVSEFNSKEELIQETEEEYVGGNYESHCLSPERSSDSAVSFQALICSCFVPFYCGVIPPTYRGVHYVDGAISDNLPRCHLKNTVTFSPYAGESDLCPRGSTLSFHEVRFNNVSIQVNSANMFRVASSFFPPNPETMAEICQNGYMDALRFLQENNLISSESPLRSLEMDAPKPACCELVKESNQNAHRLKEEHWWLDPQLTEHLPVNIKRVLCEACRKAHTAGGLLSNMTAYLKVSCTLPVVSACSLAKRLAHWIPDVSRDMSWLYGKAGDTYKQALKDDVEDYDSEKPLRRCTSLPLGLNLCSALPMTPEATPTSGLAFTWNMQSELDHLSLTPPPTPTSEFGEATTESTTSAGRAWGLGRAVGWIRNSPHLKTDDSVSFSAFE